MKILKTIENVLAKKELKVGHPAVATIRKDTLKKSLERGEFHKIILVFNHDTQNKVSDSEAVLYNYSIGLSPDCWVQPNTKIIDGVECYEINISFHSNLAYNVYVPFTTEKTYIVMNAEDTCEWSEGGIDHIREVIRENWGMIECETVEEYHALEKSIMTAELEDEDLQNCLEQIDYRVFESHKEMIEWRIELGMETGEETD